MKIAAVTETWNKAAARSNRRRARRLASLDSSGEGGFILLAQALGWLNGGSLLIPEPLLRFPVLDYLDDYLTAYRR